MRICLSTRDKWLFREQVTGVTFIRGGRLTLLGLRILFDVENKMGSEKQEDICSVRSQNLEMD